MKKKLSDVNWEEIQKVHDSGVYWNVLPKMFKISRTMLDSAEKKSLIVKKIYERKQTDKTKKKISEIRKQYLKDNPDKHPWKKNDKFKSKPCELFKNKLTENEIYFIGEYQPSDDRYYSIDIAFPNDKIGIEINGNQHYERDGTLKKYYIDRNIYLESIGWKIIDIHYSVIYNNNLLNKLIEEIKTYSLTIDEYEIISKNYFERKKILDKSKKHFCIDCNIPIHKKSIRCKKCGYLNRIIINKRLNKRTNKPTKEELSELIKTHTWTALGKKFGVSDVAVVKWAKNYNIYVRKKIRNKAP